MTLSHVDKTKTSLLSPPSNTDANMAIITEVLCELKSLQSDFGTKLDNIDTRLTGMANALTALEGKVSEIKQNVLTNTAHIKEAETRIDMTERELEKAKTALVSATKRITLHEAKTDDLENRGRRKKPAYLRLMRGSRRRTNTLQLYYRHAAKMAGTATPKVIHT